MHGCYSDVDLLCSRLLWPTRTRRPRGQIHTDSGGGLVFNEAQTEGAVLWRLVDICYHCKVILRLRKRVLNISEQDLVVLLHGGFLKASQSKLSYITRFVEQHSTEFRNP